MTDGCSIRAAAGGLGIVLDEAQEARLNAFLDELALWNRRINLVSRAAARPQLVKHILDSLTLVPHLPPGGCLLDIGTGAGFPGIPLQIALPELRVSLLEASRRKASFLKHVQRLLPLPGATVIHKRVEETLQEERYRGEFTVVVSRAAFKLPVLVAWSGFFLAPGGRLVAMKATAIEAELAAAAPVAAVSGLDGPVCHAFTLPRTGEPRQIVIYARR
jgi:16S rRNA (guanine527-N7)-methyltransferase